MFHRRIMILATVATTAICLAYPPTQAANEPPADRQPVEGQHTEDQPVEERHTDQRPADLPLFKAKYLVVTGGDEYGAVLADAAVRALGDRSFLVGKGVDAGLDWRPLADKTIWLSLDQVSQMIEFDDLDELKRYLAEPIAEEADDPFGR